MTYRPIHRLAVGETVPDFELPSAQGERVRLQAAEAPVTVVVITSNECPFALAWQSRIENVARDYADQGVRTLLVLPNDTATRPKDSPEAVRERLEAGEITLPVLFDEDQTVARSYNASATPEIFVVDRSGVLRYRGAPDADHDDESLDAQWVRQSLDAVLAGVQVPQESTAASGCSIKWRIDLVWWDGCPSHEAAEALLRATLTELGREDIAVRRRQIRSQAEAEAAAFPGSPTFQVGGVDLFPVDAQASLTCRIYDKNGRAAPLPSPEDLSARVRDVLARPWDLPGFVDPRR